jgi:hypothetical protein
LLQFLKSHLLDWTFLIHAIVPPPLLPPPLYLNHDQCWSPAQGPSARCRIQTASLRRFPCSRTTWCPSTTGRPRAKKFLGQYLVYCR